MSISHLLSFLVLKPQTLRRAESNSGSFSTNISGEAEADTT